MRNKLLYPCSNIKFKIVKQKYISTKSMESKKKVRANYMLLSTKKFHLLSKYAD